MKRSKVLLIGAVLLAVAVLVAVAGLMASGSLRPGASGERLAANVAAAPTTPLPSAIRLRGADWLSRHGVDVYYPATPCYVNCPDGPDGTYLYQCVELVVRLYKTIGYGKWPISHAYQMFNVAWNNSPGFEDLQEFKNGSATTAPRPGDIVVWQASDVNWGEGHVAIVNRVSGSAVEIVQQNIWDPSGKQPYPKATITLTKDAKGNLSLSSADGVPIIGWVHSPKMEWALQINGRYHVWSANSDKCLDVTGGRQEDGVRVVQWACNDGANQTWRITPIGNGKYEVVAEHSQKCLDVSGALRTSGANLIQQACKKTGNQLWLIKPYVDGNGKQGNRFVASHSEKCMDVTGGSKESGANVVQWDCNGGSNQTWWLSAVR